MEILRSGLVSFARCISDLVDAKGCPQRIDRTIRRGEPVCRGGVMAGPHDRLRRL